jgi:hypothetical protein
MEFTPPHPTPPVPHPAGAGGPGSPGFEGKDPDLVEQLKSDVATAAKSMEASKRELIQCGINFAEIDFAEVGAIEANPASYVQSTRHQEKRFAECVRGLQLLQKKLRDACKEREDNVSLAQVAMAIAKVRALYYAYGLSSVMRLEGSVGPLPSIVALPSSSPHCSYLPSSHVYTHTVATVVYMEGLYV